MDKFDTDFPYLVRLATAAGGHEYLDEAGDRWTRFADSATRWSTPNAARAALFASMVRRSLPLRSLGKYEIVRKVEVEVVDRVDG